MGLKSPLNLNFLQIHQHTYTQPIWHDICKFHNANAGVFPPLSLCQAKPAIKIPTKIYCHSEIPKSWRVQLQLWSTELSLNNPPQISFMRNLFVKLC